MPYKLLKHQVDFVNDTSTPIVGLVGGYRAGKTYALVHKAFKMANLNRGLHGALCEPIGSMVRKVLLPVIHVVTKELGLVEGKHYTYRKSNPESIVIHYPEGDTIIYLVGVENYDRLVGLTLAWFGIDEIDKCSTKEIALEAFKVCGSRLTVGSRQGFVCSTPEGFHFLHQYFVEEGLDGDGQPKTDRRLIRARTFDNPYIPNSYVEWVRANFTPRQAEAYLNGEFVNLVSGNVYHAFDRAKNYITKTIADYPNHILHIGMDFNFGNMSAVVSVVDKGITYVIDEITGEANTESMIKRIKQRYPSHAARQGGIRIYPDSSGQNGTASGTSISSIEQLKQAGFECFYKSKNPSVLKERVPAVNALFHNVVDGKANHRCFVNLAACKELVKGLEQQGFKDGKPDKSSGLDHCLDAFGYFVYFCYPIVGAGTYSVSR